MTIDIESLRADLIDYFGTATYYNPNAMMELIEVEQASPKEVINIALANGYNLEDYQENNLSL